MKNLLALLLFFLPTMATAKTAKELNDECRARNAPILKGGACTPTFEQCKADIASWQHTGTVGKRELSFEVLHLRAKELLYCEIDYPDAAEQLTWLQVDQQVNSDMALRYFDFLNRHKLFDQLLAEDEQKTSQQTP